MWFKKLSVVIGFASIYVVLGALSFATTYVANNTATVWIPTGFSLALLISRGDHLWPAVALGAFALNLGDNLLNPTISIFDSVAIAMAITLGNTGEALLGTYLARTFAGGKALLRKPINVVLFAALCATFPPVVSMSVGTTASYLGGLVPASRLGEATLTWYLADAVGALILTGPLIVLLGHEGDNTSMRISGLGRALEATGLIVGLVFACQAMSGVYIVPALRNWPRAYMIIPLLLWAVFRFRTRGVLIAIVLVAAVSVIGTMKGFEAFPAASQSRSLLYLQLFLGLMSVTTLAITAALTEIDYLRANLETAVQDRTKEVERLVRARTLFSTLIVHDLQSPLLDIRNALRAAAKALENGALSKDEAITLISAMDQPCSSIAARIVGLLDTTVIEDLRASATGGEFLAIIVRRIALTRGIDSSRLKLHFGTRDLVVKRSVEVEQILEGMIDNAIKHGPPQSPVEICAYRHGASLEILVADYGSGANLVALTAPFRAASASKLRPYLPTRGGRGLVLAGEQAQAIGGRLTYCASSARTTFKLVVPA